MLQGGPGASSVNLENSMTELYMRLNGTTSVYTMDHRGTGRSALLKCEAAEAFSAGSPGGAEVDMREVANCVKDVLYQIEGQTAAFSVTSAAKDIEFLVNGLNQDEDVFVYGASYGTYLTERLMHLAPSIVKGYILDGVLAEEKGNFAHFGSIREEPAQYFGQLCDQDKVCRSKYGSDVPVDQAMYDAWFETYETLDAAAIGDNACADLLTTREDIMPSWVLGTYFSTLFSIGDVSKRAGIPAVLQMVRRCNDADVVTLRALTAAQGMTLFDVLTQAGPLQPFDEVNGISFLLMHLIKHSELWLYPTPKWEVETALVEQSVFGTFYTVDYAWHCVLSGNASDPSCPALLELGQQRTVPVNYSSVELTKFSYERDEYFGKTAAIPKDTSVMVMSGKLDFQTVHSWAVDQYEKMQGDNKLLVEFEYGPHCSGIAPSTAGDTTGCGVRIIASFVKQMGDIDLTDLSCLDELPAINFDVDEDLKQYIASLQTGPQGKHKQLKKKHHVKSA
ncbi:hypothetical protein Poli38472_014753 [Pythium oligandrum]|uniref:AB hydrolase-1 domain-containing protein n=1 Tax=Pythium oligandrum TaxID=41045 RepID=A0A8K1C202_PYTOL|nr:hypothetical protein Poli38472_014753 [Pythium oligandrum]|eukprot:TMW54982.1 hypothetical protein Poli38472_014753 [Pythium oligandrum]